MDKEYVPGAGDVAIVLQGKTVYLRPTLEACTRLSRTSLPGPRELSEQCLALNFDAICIVIAAGLGKRDEEVREAVFETGTLELFGLCVRFIHIVSNGGRPLVEAGPDEAKVPLES